MAKARINEVAEELLKQALADKINWKIVEGRENAYQASFPDTSLVVSRWSPLHNSPWATVRDLSNSFSPDVATYRLEVLNDSGEIVESLLTLPGQFAYRNLRKVFELAKRQTSPTEESIDRVLGHLRQT
ncbi:MAG: hypothetical protein O2909_07350 [Chloroflexi bacterium]|nr:hypothetical protein [Chloroflexota bacterium]PKB57594.1 MAG: hypothetical protein BZY73_02485 [SAR202 cluster bacterium Casp-Chloro-G3]